VLARNTSIIGNHTGFSSNRIIVTHKTINAVIVYGSSREGEDQDGRQSVLLYQT